MAENFFTHSGHVPITLLILEFLLAHPGYFASPDPYVLLFAGIAQSWAMTRPPQRSRLSPALGNFVGPIVYSLIEASLEGPTFFQQSHHQVYWMFACGFFLIEHGIARWPQLQPPLVVLENVWRAAIPLAMYALFELGSGESRRPLAAFFVDQAHVYLATVIGLLGLLLGFADVAARRSQATIRELTARLRRYSEWSLGKHILSKAMADEAALRLQRVERAVLFLDIRGFTAWSETNSPERVVGMLNEFYERAEGCLRDIPPIKLKYTADEIMAVFANAENGARAGLALIGALSPWLAEQGLAAGAGLHHGAVVEGLLGGSEARAYDFIGDTVNTAQRLCDAAAGGELLASRAAWDAGAQRQARAAEWREIAAKGKRLPLQACRLQA